MITAIGVAAEKDQRQAEEIARQKCSACHGLDGISLSHDGPNIGGQNFDYLLGELRNIRDKRRTNALMSPVVASMGDDELRASAEYYSQQRPGITVAAGSVPEAREAEQAVSIAESMCSGCHGLQGISSIKSWPNLAGQKSDYLFKQMEDFRDGRRVGVLMTNTLHSLYDDEYRPLADYYSRLSACNETNVTAPTCQQAKTTALGSVMEFGKGVYVYAHDATYMSVFLVTPDGIVVLDPSTEESARLLKEELQRRFNLPVRYVVLTHSHLDHSAGAGVFANEAQIVSSEKAKVQIEKRIQRERETAKRAGRVAQLEVAPTITFTGRVTLSLGGKTVQIESIMPYSHSSGDMVLVDFVESELLVAVDSVSPGAFPFLDFRTAPILQRLQDVKTLEKRDFKYFSNGHSPVVPKAALVQAREYLEFLVEAVRKAIAQGQSIDEARASIELPARFAAALIPSGTGEAARRAYETKWKLNIEGAYRQIKADMEGHAVIDINTTNIARDQ